MATLRVIKKHLLELDKAVAAGAQPDTVRATLACVVGLVDELQVIVGPGLDARVGADGIIENGEEGLAGRVELTFGGCEVMGAGCVRLSYGVGRKRGMDAGDLGS